MCQKIWHERLKICTQKQVLSLIDTVLSLIDTVLSLIDTVYCVHFICYIEVQITVTSERKQDLHFS